MSNDSNSGQVTFSLQIFLEPIKLTISVRSLLKPTSSGEFSSTNWRVMLKIWEMEIPQRFCPQSLSEHLCLALQNQSASFFPSVYSQSSYSLPLLLLEADFMYQSFSNFT